MTDRWAHMRSDWDGVVKKCDARDRVPADLVLRRLWFSRGTVPIAITGLSGAGKSLLYDGLSDAIGLRYEPPGQSADAERHRSRFRIGPRTVKVAVEVIPGQQVARAAQRDRRDLP
jgi:hypothetical protein